MSNLDLSHAYVARSRQGSLISRARACRAPNRARALRNAVYEDQIQTWSSHRWGCSSAGAAESHGPNRRHHPERGDPIQQGTAALDRIGRCRVIWAASLDMKFRASSPATARGRTSMLS